MRTRILFLAAATCVATLGATAPASALTLKECSVKYQTAKQSGDTTKWNDFRKANCGSTASAAPAAPAASTSAAAPVAPASTIGNAEYPTAIDSKYASESAGRARMHTCRDSYQAAKAAGTLGGAKWIQKGGGYYSACTAKLKGA